MALAEARSLPNLRSNAMKCPICKKDVTPESDFYPFCSERCKIIDLGNWASEKYVISTPVQPEEFGEEEGQAPDRRANGDEP
jgi:endogenous inhibitor of DNA gyrase (YacG/DUF329 family)